MKAADAAALLPSYSVCPQSLLIRSFRENLQSSAFFSAYRRRPKPRMCQVTLTVNDREGKKPGSREKLYLEVDCMKQIGQMLVFPNLIYYSTSCNGLYKFIEVLENIKNGVFCLGTPDLYSAVTLLEESSPFQSNRYLMVRQAFSVLLDRYLKSPI